MMNTNQELESSLNNNQAVTLPENEKHRLKTLHKLDLLDTPIEHGFEKITRLAQKMFSVPISAITLIDRDRQWFKSAQGLDKRETPRSESFCTHAILSDDITVVPDATKHDIFKDNINVIEDPHIRFYAGCPINIENVNIGTLCIIDKKPRDFSKHDMDCLRELTSFVQDEISNHVATDVVNRENKLLTGEVTKLQRIAAIDPLTQLWNRLGVKKFFENLQNKTLRNKTSFAIGMVDVDSFKKINDTYGHNAGDLALKAIANGLVNAVRKMDTVGRWGGDEFLILLDTEDQDKIKDIFDRLIKNINDIKIEYNGHTIDLTITIGVSICNISNLNRSQNLEEILVKADDCLYSGKRAGKIGTVIYCN